MSVTWVRLCMSSELEKLKINLYVQQEILRNWPTLNSYTWALRGTSFLTTMSRNSHRHKEHKYGSSRPNLNQQSPGMIPEMTYWKCRTLFKPKYGILWMGEICSLFFIRNVHLTVMFSYHWLILPPFSSSRPKELKVTVLSSKTVLVIGVMGVWKF